jgi:hypothetical protein
MFNFCNKSKNKIKPILVEDQLDGYATNPEACDYRQKYSSRTNSHRDKKEIFPRLSRSHRDRKRTILINKLILITIIFLIYQ